MEIRYDRDSETRLAHIYDHGVGEREAEWILREMRTMNEQQFPKGWSAEQHPDEEWMRGIDEMRPDLPPFNGCY
jgi:hypothetical protein